MGLVPPAAVKLLGMLSDAHRPHRATVQRLTESGTGAATGGVRTRAWTTVLTAEPCRVAPLAAETSGVAGSAALSQMLTAGRWSVAFAARTDVQVGDKLAVTGSVATADGTVAWAMTLYVAEVGDALEQEAFRRVVCADTPTIPAP